MAAFWDWLTVATVDQLYDRGGWVTLGCMLFAGRVAVAFLHRSPHLFTAMAMFACSWMLVLTAYNARFTEHAAVLFNVASFLHVYVGGLLVLHTSPVQQSEEANHGGEGVSSLLYVALTLLLFIAAPVSKPFINVLLALIGNEPTVAKTVEGAREVLGFAGFASLAIGVHRLISTRRKGTTLQVGNPSGWWAAPIDGLIHWGPLIVLVAIFVCYEYLGLTRLVESWPFIGSSERPPPLGPHFIYGFAALRILFTLTFCSIVAYHGMPEEMRKRGFRHWFMRVFFLNRSP